MKPVRCEQTEKACIYSTFKTLTDNCGIVFTPLFPDQDNGRKFRTAQSTSIYIGKSEKSGTHGSQSENLTSSFAARSTQSVDLYSGDFP